MTEEQASEISEFCDGIEEMIFNIRSQHPQINVMNFPESALYKGANPDLLNLISNEMAKRQYPTKIESHPEMGKLLVIDISRSSMN